MRVAAFFIAGAMALACTKNHAAPSPDASRAELAPTPPGQVRTVELSVTEKGYEPSPVTLKKGEPVKLVITRKTEHTCATEIIIDEQDVNVALPLNEAVAVNFTPTKEGQLRYGCAMGKMISGVFVIE
jgi:plastocyanin domain-containing protein